MQDPLAFDFSNQELDNPGNNARWAGDKRLMVRFYRRAVLNNVRSAEAGRQIYDETDYIHITTPGDRLSNIDAPVEAEHKVRFAELWERYQKQQTEPQTGTPVTMAPWISVSLAQELKAMGIHTVEALAELPDVHASKLMGGNEIRRKAKAFLDSAAAGAEQSRLEAELAKRDNQIEALMAQMAAQQAQMQTIIESAGKKARGG